MSRPCDALKCAEKVASGRFLCIRHWHLVPLATKRTINERYRAGRKDFAFLSDVEYLQACVDAIDGLAALEGRAPEFSSYHRLLAAARRKAAATSPDRIEQQRAAG